MNLTSGLMRFALCESVSRSSRTFPNRSDRGKKARTPLGGWNIYLTGDRSFVAIKRIPARQFREIS
jgi:hypothetical protein